jgi:hypothetical protein
MRNHLPVTVPLLSCPFKNRSDDKLYLKKKESGSENTSQLFSIAKHCGCKSSSKKGRKLHIKMCLKSKSKNH